MHTPPVQWRPPTRADAASWARCLDAVARADGTSEFFTEEDLLDEFEDASRDPSRDALFAFDEAGEVIAFGWVQPRSGAAAALRRIILWGDVHPNRRREGLGEQLLPWLEDRGRQRYAAMGDDVPGQLEVDVDARLASRRAFFEKTGYAAVRHFFEMRRELSHRVPAAAVPEGVDVRSWDRTLDEKVRLVHNEVFADHWGSSPQDADHWRQWVVGRNFRPDLSVIAFAGEEIAGYSLNSFYPRDAEENGFSEGWIDRLGVRRPWRRQGLGAALLGASMRAFASAGLEFATLGVDTENATGALHLYQRLGFETVRQRTTLAKPVGVPCH